MLIQLENDRACQFCGSTRFHHCGYDGDGGCQSWIIASCAKCKKNFELWHPVSYTRVWTESTVAKVMDEASTLIENFLKREDLKLDDPTMSRVSEILTKMIHDNNVVEKD